MRLFLVAAIGLIALAGSAEAANLSAAQTKAPGGPRRLYDWSGFCVGAHFGDAAGSSRWSTAEPGAPASGLGILVGDGRHPDPGQIGRGLLRLSVLAVTATLDYPFVVNPAYNCDCSPVSVIGTQLHYKI